VLCFFVIIIGLPNKWAKLVEKLNKIVIFLLKTLTEAKLNQVCFFLPFQNIFCRNGNWEINTNN